MADRSGLGLGLGLGLTRTLALNPYPNPNPKLSQGLADTFEPIMMSFSAQTSANQTQDILDGKFEKRRQGRDKDTGLDYTMWGPMLGKRLVIEPQP